MNFQIIKQIGRGAIYTYYRAENRAGRALYLKVLNEGPGKDIARRFEREAKILEELSHPNIVKLLWHGKIEQRPALAFEFLEGDTLETLLQKKGRLTQKEALKITKPILSALAYIHSKGILHRDIKPSNILLAKNGIPKLADFGLAIGRDIPAVTLNGTLLGTPNYMPPEQIEGKNLDPRSDLYSLGITLLELLTGNKAFYGKSYGEVLKKVLTSEPEGVDTAPEAIRLLINKDKDKRPKSADQVLRILGEKPFLQKRTLVRKIRTPVRIAAGLALAVILSLVYYNQKSPDKQDSFTPLISADSIKEETAVDYEKEVVSMDEIEITPRTVTPIRDIWLNVLPFAEIYYQGKKIGETPPPISYRFEEQIPLLTFKNPAFPDIKKEVKGDTVLVNLATEVSYLRVKVKPWAEVWIDEELMGITPLDKPILILPGHHTIILHNPHFKDEKMEIIAKKGDTVSIVLQLR